MSYTQPCLPHYITLPLRLLPDALRNLAIAQALNLAFARERQQGELDFLEGQRVRVAIIDTSLDVTITLSQGQIQPVTTVDSPELTITGSLYDYMLLMTGREDPDTLFFQRRLRMQGDTGLGVHLKNFLAAVDPASLPLGNLIQPALAQGLKMYEWLM